MPYHYTDALVNDLYPSEANVDLNRIGPDISDLAAFWPDLFGVLKSNPAEVYAILARDSLYRKAIPYSEIAYNFDNASWWCHNILPIVNILQSIPSKDKTDNRSIEDRFLYFLNAWKLECFLAEKYKATPHGGGNPAGALHCGEPTKEENRPDLIFDGKETEVKIISNKYNSSSAIHYYATDGYKYIHHAKQLILHKVSAKNPILVKNIIDVHNGAEPIIVNLKEHQPTLFTLPIIVPEGLLKYLNSKIKWKPYKK